MRAPSCITLDFESHPIEDRPDYPPEPVGLAVRWPGERARYLAFAHPLGGNTHTRADVVRELRRAYRSGLPLLFHNAKFDLDVAEAKLGVPLPPMERVEDTMVLLFLRDPRAVTFSLKPSAEKLLGEPPAERDAVARWLVEHQPVPGVRVTLKNAAAYTAYAPVTLVSAYARGDVDRTLRLHRKLWPEIKKRKMLAAYRREVELTKPMLAMERNGVPVDVPRLRADVEKYTDVLREVNAWLCRETGAPEGTNWDSNDALAKSLVACGAADAGKMGRTPKSGKLATNKKALARGVTDARVLSVLKYRSRLGACLSTFMRPWLAVAEKPASGGRIFARWFTTRTDEHGARTGRMASSPNLQNLVKRKVKLWSEKPAWWTFPDLPDVRGYVEVGRGRVIVDRDFSQQELRALAHYAEGDFLGMYQRDPWADVHAYIKKKAEELLSEELEREVVKITVFMIIYGGGVPAVQEFLGCDEERARRIRDAVRDAVPGLGALTWAVRQRCAEGRPIRTWGGREYHVEPPRVVDGEVRSMDYKMVNLLIQGSCADVTKAAVLEFERRRDPDWRLLMVVHDELVVDVPSRDEHRAHRVLDECMRSPKLDVEMLSEGKSGKRWWGMRKHDEKGKRA